MKPSSATLSSTNLRYSISWVVSSQLTPKWLFRCMPSIFLALSLMAGCEKKNKDIALKNEDDAKICSLIASKFKELIAGSSSPLNDESRDVVEAVDGTQSDTAELRSSLAVSVTQASLLSLFPDDLQFLPLLLFNQKDLPGTKIMSGLEAAKFFHQKLKELHGPDAWKYELEALKVQAEDYVGEFSGVKTVANHIAQKYIFAKAGTGTERLVNELLRFGIKRYHEDAAVLNVVEVALTPLVLRMDVSFGRKLAEKVDEYIGNEYKDLDQRETAIDDFERIKLCLQKKKMETKSPAKRKAKSPAKSSGRKRKTPPKSRTPIKPRTPKKIKKLPTQDSEGASQRRSSLRRSIGKTYVEEESESDDEESLPSDAEPNTGDHEEEGGSEAAADDEAPRKGDEQEDEPAEDNDEEEAAAAEASPVNKPARKIVRRQRPLW
mmetsp:Transcript_4625/g.11285  ORF Transcript_4625/g.11285 Transcript_4625/m.11285 type:complete len:435 (-) Transcript_4625:219-1523(-)